MGVPRTVAGVAVALLWATALLLSQDWDYLIWIPRTTTADPIYRFIKDEKAGYINRGGRVVIPPILPYFGGNSGGEFHDGLLEIDVGDGIYINADGRKVIDRGLYRGWDFSEGLAVAMAQEGGKWGYIDTKGEFAISPRFASSTKDDVYPFENGLAQVEVGGRFGYIDHTGSFVIPPRFLDGDSFHDEMARVIVEGPCIYVRIPQENPSLEFGIVPRGTKAEESLPACKYTFINKSGTLISAARYEYALPFGEGLAPVRVGHLWGFIDRNGALIIAPHFDSAWSFSDGLALVSQKGLLGYVDHSGTYVIRPAFKYAEPFAERRAVVGDTKSGYSYIDPSGHAVISGKFALASPFFKGLAQVKLLSADSSDGINESSYTGTFAYIDSTGRKVFTYGR